MLVSFSTSNLEELTIHPQLNLESPTSSFDITKNRTDGNHMQITWVSHAHHMGIICPIMCLIPEVSRMNLLLHLPMVIRSQHDSCQVRMFLSLRGFHFC